LTYLGIICGHFKFYLSCLLNELKLACNSPPRWSGISGKCDRISRIPVHFFRALFFKDYACFPANLEFLNTVSYAKQSFLQLRIKNKAKELNNPLQFHGKNFTRKPF